MHLSTSSFKNNFIVLSVAVFSALLIIYSVTMHFFPHTLQGANQWQANVLKAQDYAFSNQNWDMVAVGSSMIYNVPLEKTSSNVYNLAFAGGASCTGLELINGLQNKKPKVVFIEANETVMRGIDRGLLKKVKYDFKYIPALQEVNRPDIVFMQTMMLLKNTKKNKVVSSVDRTEPLEGPLKIQQDRSKILVNQEVLEKRIEEIELEVSKLQQQGIDIFFIEPPMHPSLFKANRTEQVRNALLKKFPQDKYNWFLVDWSNYKTSDGLHLEANSAKKYAEELLKWAKTSIGEM